MTNRNFCVAWLGLMVVCGAVYSQTPSQKDQKRGGPVAAGDAKRDKLTLGDKEVYEGRRILLDEDSYPRQPGKLVEGPIVERDEGKVTIRFALDKSDDVLVRIVDPEGKTLRNLACGVLGTNAPEPFQKGSLKQEIVWDGKGNRGKPAPAGCKVRVAVGLRPRFERFVANETR